MLAYRGQELRAADGEKIGKIEEIYPPAAQDRHGDGHGRERREPRP
jgi:hypothetical protein